MRDIKFLIIWESWINYWKITPLDNDFIMPSYPERIHKMQYIWLKDNNWEEIYENYFLRIISNNNNNIVEGLVIFRDWCFWILWDWYFYDFNNITETIWDEIKIEIINFMGTKI